MFNGNPIVFNDPLGNVPGSGGTEKQQIDDEAAKEKAKSNQGGESSDGKPNTPSVMIRGGISGGPFSNDVNGPTSIISLYGNKSYYTTKAWGKSGSEFRIDEPNSFIQAQFRIGGKSSNTQFSVNWFKQKYEGTSGFKIEAPTALHLGIGKNIQLASLWNMFNLSANFSFGGGPELGKLVINGSDVGGYKPIGVGASAIGRVDFTFLKRATFFIAGTLHHLQTFQQETSIGTQPSEAIGSFGISAGGGFSIGGNR